MPERSGITVQFCRQRVNDRHVNSIITLLFQGMVVYSIEHAPCSHINSLFVGGRHSETNRRHHGLIPCWADHLPLGSMRVTGQHTLVVFINGNLTGLQNKHRVRLSFIFGTILSLIPCNVVPRSVGNHRWLLQGWRISQGCLGSWA